MTAFVMQIVANLELHNVEVRNRYTFFRASFETVEDCEQVANLLRSAGAHTGRQYVCLKAQDMRGEQT